MRLVSACTIALPLTPLGMPKMPYRKNRSTTTISTTLPLRFFFMIPILYSEKSMPKVNIRTAPKNRLAPSRAGKLRRFLRRHRRNRILGHFHLDPVRRHLHDDGVVLDRKNRAANAARRRDPVPRLDARKHLLPLLLTLLLRPDHHQVKHGDQ